MKKWIFYSTTKRPSDVVGGGGRLEGVSPRAPLPAHAFSWIRHWEGTVGSTKIEIVQGGGIKSRNQEFCSS